MSLIEQRSAFEKTYEDGNWGRLESYFSEHLTYEVMNMPCEVATYRDGRIERLIDIYDRGESIRYERWTAEWGAGLDASYI